MNKLIYKLHRIIMKIRKPLETLRVRLFRQNILADGVLTKEKILSMDWLCEHFECTPEALLDQTRKNLEKDWSLRAKYKKNIIQEGELYVVYRKGLDLK
jgi:hypothetical protein